MAKLFAEVTLDGGKIGQMIDIIADRSTALKRDIQVTAVCCALHAAHHGDVTLMQKLDDKLGDGWYRTTLRQWAIKNGPFGYKLKDGKAGTPEGYTYSKPKAEALKAEYDADNMACTTRLMGQPWEKAKKEPDFDGFDLLAVLTKAVNKAEKYGNDETKSKHPKTVIDPALLAAAKKLIEHARLVKDANPDDTPPSIVPATMTAEAIEPAARVH